MEKELIQRGWRKTQQEISGFPKTFYFHTHPHLNSSAPICLTYTGTQTWVATWDRWDDRKQLVRAVKRFNTKCLRRDKQEADLLAKIDKWWNAANLTWDKDGEVIFACDLPKIEHADAVRFIRKTSGKIFSVKFRKRDSEEIREMSCRLGVHKHVKGTGTGCNEEDNNLVRVFDMVNKGYRSIPIEGLLEVRIDGEWKEVVHNG